MNNLTPDLYSIIVEYVREHGVVSGAEVALPVRITRGEIAARMTPAHPDYDPAFDQQISAAKSDFTLDRFHPSKDRALRKGVIKAIRMMVESGQSTVTTDKDENGQIIKTRETVKAGIPSWVYYAVFPPDGITIDALRAAVASQTAYLVKTYSEGITKDAYEIIAAFLRSYLFDQLDTRIQSGQDVGPLSKYLGAEGTSDANGDDIPADGIEKMTATYIKPLGIYEDDDGDDRSKTDTIEI